MAATITQLRVLVQDAKGPKEYLPDGHYTEVLVLEPDNPYRAAAIIARMIAAKFADQVDTTVDKISIKRDQKYKHYIDLADKLDKLADKGTSGVSVFGSPVLTGVSKDEIKDVRNDPDRPENEFRKGVHDNPPNDTKTFNENC